MDPDVPATPPSSDSQVPPPSPTMTAATSYSLPAQPPRKRSNTGLWIVIGGGAFFIFVMAVFMLVYFAVKSDKNNGEFAGGFGDKIAVIDLDGVILDSKDFIKQLKKYDEDSSIKAIILRINSPGGGAEASQEMYTAVKRISDRNRKDKNKKPIISSISTVGASGAYYVAAGTNKIYAGNASIVG